MRLIGQTAISGDCWLIKSNRRDGYVYKRTQGRNRYAHRVFYELLVGELIPGMEIDHLCRARNCVNPRHLEQVTPEENRRRASKSQRVGHLTYCTKGHPKTGLDVGRRGCNKCFLKKFEVIERELVGKI